MRFSQFKEGAMEDMERIMQKTFSPERKAVQAEVLRIARAVEMGKDDKMMLARAITELTKSELEVKRSDPDLKVSTEQNLNILKRAMDKLTGVKESIGEIAELNETEVVKIIRSKKGIGNLRNRQALDGLSKIKNIELDKNAAPKKAVGEDMDPEGPEVTIGDYTTTHFYMCGSAIKTAEKHADKPGMEKLIQLQDMVYKLERAVMDTGEASEDVKNFARELHIEVMNTAAEIGVEDEVAEYQGMHLNSIIKGDPKPGFGRVDQVEESLTEAEFDEAAGEKDACYHKVKSRYKVWPSAYASGALVKCRKVGAANWGNSKKK